MLGCGHSQTWAQTSNTRFILLTARQGCGISGGCFGVNLRSTTSNCQACYASAVQIPISRMSRTYSSLRRPPLKRTTRLRTSGSGAAAPSTLLDIE